MACSIYRWRATYRSGLLVLTVSLLSLHDIQPYTSARLDAFRGGCDLTVAASIFLCNDSGGGADSCLFDLGHLFRVVQVCVD